MARQTILVVDDEPAIRMTAAAILEMHGYDTATAENGEIAFYRALELKPELVLSDVVMPRMNGVQLAIALAQVLPSVRILLFSGNSATTDIMEGARSQGYRFRILAKPVPMEELLRAVRAALDPGLAMAS